MILCQLQCRLRGAWVAEVMEFMRELGPRLRDRDCDPSSSVADFYSPFYAAFVMGTFRSDKIRSGPS